MFCGNHCWLSWCIIWMNRKSLLISLQECLKMMCCSALRGRESVETESPAEQLYFMFEWVMSGSIFHIWCRQIGVFSGSRNISTKNNNNNLLHLYSAFLDTQSALHSKGAISSSTTNVQHPPGWCDGSHSAPERSPHTSLLVERRQSDEANQCMGMIRRPWCQRPVG